MATGFRVKGSTYERSTARKAMEDEDRRWDVRAGDDGADEEV